MRPQLLAIATDQLRRLPPVIGIAVGSTRRRPAWEPARAGRISTLVADTVTARAIAALLEEPIQLAQLHRRPYLAPIRDPPGGVVGGRGVAGHGRCFRENACSVPGPSSMIWSRTRTLMGWAGPGRDLTSRWSSIRVTSIRWPR
jgi:hypothetical protein